MSKVIVQFQGQEYAVDLKDGLNVIGRSSLCSFPGCWLIIATACILSTCRGTDPRNAGSSGAPSAPSGAVR